MDAPELVSRFRNNLLIPRMIASLILLSALRADTAYFVLWSFPQKVDLQTAVVRVSGGTLRSIAVSADGRSGQINATAARDCITIEWSIRSVSGLTFRGSKAWLRDCAHLYIPIAR